MSLYRNDDNKRRGWSSEFNPNFDCPGGRAQIREQRDEHQTVQLLASPVLATQFHGRIHVVIAFRWRKRYLSNE